MIRIIGDVHGKINEYLATARFADSSVQVGDMGFRYDEINLDPTKHVFFGGNHDNYDVYYNTPNALRNFGMDKVGGLDFFYVRGAFSIDKHARIRHEQRTGYKSWWANEELSESNLSDAVALYTRLKPSVVFTHDGPKQATHLVSNPSVLTAFGWDSKTFNTATQAALTLMFMIHQPKLWIFGHYHKDLKFTVDGTQFACLPELGFVDVDQYGNIQ